MGTRRERPRREPTRRAGTDDQPSLAGEATRRAWPPPPALPAADREGCILRTRVGPQRRSVVRRALLRPSIALGIGVATLIALGVYRPTADALPSDLLDEVMGVLPGALAELDPLQVLLLPFLLFAAWLVARGLRHRRLAADAVLSIDVTGRLVQVDGHGEHVDLDHLLHVDVAPNAALVELNERTPVGSLLVFRLTDATGAVVDVNPGMWEAKQAIIDVVRHYAWHGDAAITPEAAERYALPVRGRDGHEHLAEEGAALEGHRPRDEGELEAPLRRAGLQLERAEADGEPASGSA
jgi:hypothetical protein